MIIKLQLLLLLVIIDPNQKQQQQRTTYIYAPKKTQTHTHIQARTRILYVTAYWWNCFAMCTSDELEEYVNYHKSTFFHQSNFQQHLA